jgi:ATP adenylyltransferase
MYLSTCAYCSATADEAWIITDDAVALPHSNPMANCHMVVAPRRHVLAFYDLDVQEQRVVWTMVGEIQKRISSALKVDGFYVGFADGDDEHPIHAHIHVVPRSPGDSLRLPDGIDWVDA